MKYLKIPKERIGVLIGQNGETKKNIELISKITLDIDSDEGEVVIQEHENTDALMLLKVENVIHAIARGFSPEHAFALFKDENDFFLFDIHDYVGKKDTHIIRLKSRIIGQHGKTKRALESITGSSISIYGHTVALIADIDTIDILKKAVDMLLSGSKHSTVYRYLEREMKQLRQGTML